MALNPLDIKKQLLQTLIGDMDSKTSSKLKKPAPVAAIEVDVSDPEQESHEHIANAMVELASANKSEVEEQGMPDCMDSPEAGESMKDKLRKLIASREQ